MTVQWTWAGARRALGIAAVAIGAGAALGYFVSHERGPSRAPSKGAAGPPASASASAPPPGGKRPPAAPRPPNAAEMAVVTPLAPGSPLDGWTVTSVNATNAGYLSIHATEDGKPMAALEVKIVLGSPDGPHAPAGAGPYAIYYSGDRFDPSVAKALAAVAAVVGKNAAPPPPGMTAYAAE